MKKNKNKAREGKSLQVIKKPNTAVLKKNKRGKNKNKKTLQINGNVNELMTLSSPVDASSIPKKNKKNKKGKKNIAKNEVKPVTDVSTENEGTPMAEMSSANTHTNPKKRKRNKNKFLAQKTSGTTETEESSTNGLVSLKKRKIIENELVSQEDSGKSDVAGEGKPNLPDSEGKKKRRKKKKNLNKGSPSAPDPSTTVSVPSESRTALKPKVRKDSPDQAGRTLFIGNVSANAKVKDLRRLFNKYGKIETVRFRSAAVNDPKQSKKEAVITRNLHPSRSTLNAYIRFADSSMMEAALEVNGVEFLGKHLRVDKAVPNKERNTKNSVFVANLSFEVEDEDLHAHFARCGEIESVRVVRDTKLLSGKGFGYVNFMSTDSVEIALRLNGQLFMNRQLRVQRCLEKSKADRLAKRMGKKAKKVEKKVIKAKKENIIQEDADDSEEGNIKNKKFKKAKNNLKTKKLGVVSKKQGLAFMKPIKTNSTKRERKSDDFSGVKMMETKKFKKMKKKGKFTSEDKKKFAIARQLTGVKPRAKKAA